MKDYDVIIVGAGLGGMVCACYLAKSGRKVLIVEKNNKVGGCCTSFQSNGMFFNSCVHSLGSCRPGGFIANILSDLDIGQDLKLDRYDPSDVVIAPSGKIFFDSNFDQFAQSAKVLFPNETRAIDSFIKFFKRVDSYSSFLNLNKITFKNFLDSYFSDERLKSIIAFPVFGNGGLPPSKMSASIAVLLLKEFMFDGGYYPEGGLQALPDVLLKKAMDEGCCTVLDSAVTKISFKNDKVNGVVINNDKFVSCDTVISNSDMRTLSESMLSDTLSVGVKNFKRYVGSLQNTLSIFTIYLGMNRSFDLKNECCNLWVLNDYDLDNNYLEMNNGIINDKSSYVIFTSPLFDKSSQNTGRPLYILINAAYQNPSFWEKNSNRFKDVLLENANKVLPGLLGKIDFSFAADPLTIKKFTSNFNGSAYGWESTVRQINNLNFKRLLRSIDGLKFVGHWTGQGFGIPSVMQNGKNVALTILNKK